MQLPHENLQSVAAYGTATLGAGIVQWLDSAASVAQSVTVV